MKKNTGKVNILEYFLKSSKLTVLLKNSQLAAKKIFIKGATYKSDEERFEGLYYVAREMTWFCERKINFFKSLFIL